MLSIILLLLGDSSVSTTRFTLGESLGEFLFDLAVLMLRSLVPFWVIFPPFGMELFFTGGWSNTANVVSGAVTMLLVPLENDEVSLCSERPELNPLELEGRLDKTGVGTPRKLNIFMNTVRVFK